MRRIGIVLTIALLSGAAVAGQDPPPLPRFLQPPEPHGFLSRAGKVVTDFFAHLGELGNQDRGFHIGETYKPTFGDLGRGPRGVGLTWLLDARVIDAKDRAEGREKDGK
jgi:hypothetical protein